MAEEIKKTDKELVQERIKELETAIVGGRQTGKTYRAVNNAIEELFNRPKGSQIALVDTNTDKDNNALHDFVDLFSKRMQRDFPGTYFRIIYPKPNTAIVIRTSDTYQETAKKRLEQWKKKLEGME